MYYTLNWKLQIAISTLIIVTQCQGMLDHTYY